jgi:hypothetical protein
MHAQLHRQLDLAAVARIEADRVDPGFELAQDLCAGSGHRREVGF